MYQLGRRVLFSTFTVLLVLVAFELIGGPRILETIAKRQVVVVEKDYAKRLVRVVTKESMSALEKLGNDLNPMEAVRTATGVEAMSYFLTDTYMEMLDGIEIGETVEIEEKTVKSVLMGTTLSKKSQLMSAQKRD